MDTESGRYANTAIGTDRGVARGLAKSGSREPYDDRR
jgi:hypothetical protein